MAQSPPFFGWAPAAWRGRGTVSGWQCFNHGDHLVPQRSQPSQLCIEVGQPPAQCVSAGSHGHSPVSRMARRFLISISVRPSRWAPWMKLQPVHYCWVVNAIARRRPLWREEQADLLVVANCVCALHDGSG